MWSLAERQRVSRTVEQDGAGKSNRSQIQPGPTGHDAEFGFILRMERSSRQFINAPTNNRFCSFTSLLWLQFGERTEEDKGRSAGPVRRWMEVTWA